MKTIVTMEKAIREAKAHGANMASAREVTAETVDAAMAELGIVVACPEFYTPRMAY